MIEQIKLFEDHHEKECENCYQCAHFSEFKELRTCSDRDGDFGVFGMCFKTFCKNGSYALYPIYIPGGKCKDFKKARKKNELR